MEIRKLLAHKYAQCGMYKNYTFINGDIFMEWGFISYNTRIIIVRGSRILYTGYYSRTTSRQITWMLDEYGDTLKGITKKTLEIMEKNGCAYDAVTGELTPLTHDELREIRHERDAAFHYGYGW